MLLFSAAMANDLVCFGYTEDGTPSDNHTDTCNDEQEYCVTVQTIYKDGEIQYVRGCGAIDDDAAQEGCIITTIDGNDGSICYARCQTNMCNTHTNLQYNKNSSAMTTGSILVVFYTTMIMMWLLKQ